MVAQLDICKLFGRHSEALLRALKFMIDMRVRCLRLSFLPRRHCVPNRRVIFPCRRFITPVASRSFAIGRTGSLKCVAGHVRIPYLDAPPHRHLLSHLVVRSKMAAPQSRFPCRLFASKDGCRYGRKCRFSHDLDSASGAGTSPHSSGQNPSSSTTPATPRTRFPRTGNRNICDFYWNTGQCNRGFDCTFKHQKTPNPQSGGTSVAGGPGNEEDAANSALEYFTADNLTQVAGVGLHSTQEGTPENAHNAIKVYLGGRSLNTPTDMKPLISILASVNRRNRSWVRMMSLLELDGR